LADDDEAELRRNLQRFEPGKSQNHVELTVFSTTRGENSRTSFVSARMCSGVVPKHPPTTWSQPFSAHFATLGTKISAVSGKPVGDIGSGRPAFGYALM